MKKIYATEWQGIPFSFIQTSQKELARADFYNLFYEKLFKKYSDYEALPEAWRCSKSELADLLSQQTSGAVTVLSYGCGLGYMEQRIHNLHKKRIELHVQEYASDALQWLSKVLPATQIHEVNDYPIGPFDMIYLSAVDYAMTDDELVNLLSRFKNELKSNGQIIMISASYLDYYNKEGVLRAIKEMIKAALHFCRLRDRGQLWGWMRTRSDYQRLIRAAGFVNIKDEFLVTSNQKTYWISGRLT